MSAIPVLSLIGLFDSAPVLLVHLGMDGRIHGVNRHFERVGGWPGEELPGRDFVDTFVPSRAREAARAMLAESGFARAASATFAIAARDGAERDVEWRREPAYDAEGAVAGVVLAGVERRLAETEEARRHARPARQPSDGRFRELLEQAPDGIFLLDDTGTLIDASPGGCAMLGWTRAELVGVHAEQLLPAGAAPMWLPAEKLGASVASERRIRRKDGECITVAISAQRLTDGTVLAIARDVSAWRRAEEAGAVVAQRYRMLFDQAPYCIHEIDRSGRVVSMNPAGLRMLGLSSEEQIRGRSCLEAVRQQDEPRVAAQLRAALEGEAREVEFESTGGRQLQSSFVPLKGPDGRPDHAMGITLDVTERRAAEQELRRIKALLLDAHRLADLGTWQLDLRTNDLWWSDEQYRLYGFEKGVTRPSQALFLSLIHPDDRAMFAAAFDHCLTMGSWEGDYRIVRPDGEIRYLHGIGKTTFDRSGARVVAGTNQDITEQKLAEQRLVHSLREKELLIREIHHRVKNNLQIVSSLVRFHDRKAAGADAETVFAELRQRLVAMSLVHEKLYQSRDLYRVDAGDYLRSLVVALCASSLDAQRIELRFAAGEVALPIEQALPLGMIACELVTNVLKHAFPGERRGTAVIGLHAEAGSVVLAVEDDGVGFPESFDPARDGSFGWEVVRALVGQIDGELEVRAGAGSRVRVRFSTASPP